MKRERNADNRGFSLVELIIVIAIMAVLVGVLAPQFIKYVESSRRAVDINNANEIEQAVVAAIANGTLNYDRLSGAAVAYIHIGEDVDDIPEADVKVKGSLKDVNGNPPGFLIYFKTDTNEVQVYLCGYDVTSDAGAQAYKNATAAVAPPVATELDDL